MDEIWTYVGRKQANLTIEERATRSDIGDVYLFTAQDQDSRLIVHHLLGKRSADNTRRFMVQLADNMAQPDGGYGCPQISVDGFPAYPEAVDLAFGKDCKLGVIIKEYRNARLQYDPSEIVGTKREADAWRDRGSFDMHLARRAEQPDDPHVYEAVLPADDWLLAEDREPRSRREPAYGLFQFLLAAGDDEGHAGASGWTDGPLLDV